MRIIRRYKNRKLYDTKEGHYVSLAQVATLVREGEDIQVLHRETGADLTAMTLALVIYEEEKQGTKMPAAGLRKIIETGGV